MKGEEEESNDTQLDIATVGSKNRVCLPPKTVEHMRLKQGDYLAFILAYTEKDNKPYVRFVAVKEKNLTINSETKETITDVLR
jgi:hypothetical protein